MRRPVAVAVLVVAGCGTTASSGGRAEETADRPDAVAASDTAVAGDSIEVSAVPEVFRGVYAAGFEVSSFRPCGSLEQWWVADTGPLHEGYEATASRPYEQVYVVVRGDTSAAGHVGHLGLYQRYLRVQVLDSIRPLEEQQPPGQRVRCPVGL